MRLKALTMTLLWSFWVSGRFCSPIPEYTNRAMSYCIKYQWPQQVLELMFHAKSTQRESFTHEQARNFVTNGLLYLERTMRPGEAFDILGGDNDKFSRSFVRGTDETLGTAIKTRWRWLPLIEHFDPVGRPIYHTSRWSDGTVLKSMNLLRIDLFSSHDMSFFLPTAIVRPVRKGIGFGRGLQFDTVYEFPTSFAKYMRQPTIALASQLRNAILKDSGLWLASVSSANRDSVELNYRMLTAEWIYYNLQTALRQLPGARRPASQVGSDYFDLPLTEAERRCRHWEQSQAFQPAPEAPYGNWNELRFVYPSQVGFESGGPSNLWAAPRYETTFPHLGTSSSTGPPSPWLGGNEPNALVHAPTPLRFLGNHPDGSTSWVRPDGSPASRLEQPVLLPQDDRNQPDSRVYAPVPLRFVRDHPDGSGAWVPLDRSSAASAGSGKAAAVISSDADRSGFSRWRRPDTSTLEQASQS